MHQAWFHQRKHGLRSRIERFYGNSQDLEVQKIIYFLRQHPELEVPTGMTPPYEWAKDYKPDNIVVKSDDRERLLYIENCGKRAYFPRDFMIEQIQSSTAIGLMEQDNRSPHRYISDDFNVDQGDIGVFIGASDGLFCLSIIERLSKAYLFEPCAAWHEPLRATFTPWGDKVEVVPLAVSSKNGDASVTLDRFFENRHAPNFIQVDVDGRESDVLSGGMRLLRNATKLRLSICTYHNRLDFPRFEKILEESDYIISHSPGFYFIGVRAPYFRRGILRAMRKKTGKSRI